MRELPPLTSPLHFSALLTPTSSIRMLWTETASWMPTLWPRGTHFSTFVLWQNSVIGHNMIKMNRGWAHWLVWIPRWTWWQVSEPREEAYCSGVDFSLIPRSQTFGRELLWTNSADSHGYREKIPWSSRRRHWTFKTVPEVYMRVEQEGCDWKSSFSVFFLLLFHVWRVWRSRLHHERQVLLLIYLHWEIRMNEVYYFSYLAVNRANVLQLVAVCS